MNSLYTSLRLTVVTLLVCVAGYTILVLGFAKVVSPATADGSLIKAPDGRIVGSRQVAQKFTQPGYFWPRPSAVDFNGAGAAGSNKSPTSSELTDRARKTVDDFGASSGRLLPAELAAASGSGLDPHITEHAALYQLERVALTRNMPRAQVEALVKDQAFAPGGAITPERLVNVLELNLALDAVARGDGGASQPARK